LKRSFVYAVLVVSVLAFGGCSDSGGGGNSTDTTTSTDGNTTSTDGNTTSTDGNTTSTIPPTLTAFSASIAENTITGSTVGTVTTDAGDSAITAYTLSDTTNFSISSSGVITTVTTFDYETSTDYSLSVTATNSAGVSESVNISISITGIDDEAPTFTSLTTATVAEEQRDAITLVATDVDSPSLTYSISGGTDANSFDVNTTTGKVTFKLSPNFATDSHTYIFTAKVTDGAGNEATQDITINIFDVVIKKTGQIKSYDVNGTEVTDGSILDDGHYQTGTAPRYTRASEIVTDELTNLMWQDDAGANSTQKMWLTQANYDTCSNDTSLPACYDTTGDTATTYCEDLSLGGYTDWRLPTIVELQGIVVDGKYDPAIDVAAFSNYTSSGYWSSTTYASYTSDAWSVYFNGGNTNSNSKGNNLYVRCVRAGQ